MSSDHTFRMAILSSWQQIQDSAPCTTCNCGYCACAKKKSRPISNRGKNEANSTTGTKVIIMWMGNVVECYEEALAFRGAEYVDSQKIVPVDRDTGIRVSWRRVYFFLRLVVFLSGPSSRLFLTFLPHVRL